MAAVEGIAAPFLQHPLSANLRRMVLAGPATKAVPVDAMWLCLIDGGT
jgi:hypothetical protein